MRPAGTRNRNAYYQLHICCEHICRKCEIGSWLIQVTCIKMVKKFVTVVFNSDCKLEHADITVAIADYGVSVSRKQSLAACRCSWRFRGSSRQRWSSRTSCMRRSVVWRRWWKWWDSAMLYTGCRGSSPASSWCSFLCYFSSSCWRYQYQLPALVYRTSLHFTLSTATSKTRSEWPIHLFGTVCRWFKLFSFKIDLFSYCYWQLTSIAGACLIVVGRLCSNSRCVMAPT